MFAKLNSMGIFGMDAYPVSVEIDLSQGLPSFDVVGLPDASVRESRERVRAAMKNCGLDFPVSPHHHQSCTGRHPQGRPDL